jgi:predicted PurR-regulated permease PerM
MDATPNLNTAEATTEENIIQQRGFTGRQLRLVVLTLITVFGLYLCYRLAVPFLPALTWALALAVLFAPVQRWFESKRLRPSLAAAACVTLIGVIVVVPVTFVSQQLVEQTAKGAELVEGKIKSGEWRSAIDRQPQLAYLAQRIEQQFDLPGTVKSLASWLSASAGALVRGSVFQLLGLVLTFYLLFFFLRDRNTALKWLRSHLPLFPNEVDKIFSRTTDTIVATIYGLLAVSSLQGLLGGLMFWWLGLSAPLLWGVVMAVLAVLPVFGAFVVWIPAALFLLTEGEWLKALILTLWGVLVIGTSDNLLRPILVGNRLKLHTVLAFMSVVGGLLLFGAAGLILGPVALTVTLVMLEIWQGQTTNTNSTSTEPEPVDR